MRFFNESHVLDATIENECCGKIFQMTKLKRCSFASQKPLPPPHTHFSKSLVPSSSSPPKAAPSGLICLNRRPFHISSTNNENATSEKNAVMPNTHPGPATRSIHGSMKNGTASPNDKRYRPKMALTSTTCPRKHSAR